MCLTQHQFKKWPRQIVLRKAQLWSAYNQSEHVFISPCTVAYQHAAQTRCSRPPEVSVREVSGSRREEDVEQHSEQDEDYISHDAQPEARVLEQLLVVAGEEDVANGHPRHAAAYVGHEGDLGAFQG